MQTLVSRRLNILVMLGKPQRVLMIATAFRVGIVASQKFLSANKEVQHFFHTRIGATPRMPLPRQLVICRSFCSLPPSEVSKPSILSRIAIGTKGRLQRFCTNPLRILLLIRTTDRTSFPSGRSALLFPVALLQVVIVREAKHLWHGSKLLAFEVTRLKLF